MILNKFNDRVNSTPLSNPLADHTVVVVWDPQTLSVYVDGVPAGTVSRLTLDYPTSRYRLMVAVQPGLIHSGDNQFYKGAMRGFVLYDRPLSGGEVTDLHLAMTATALRRGDLDGDADVDLDDLRACIFMLVGTVPPDLSKADLDGDGQLLLADLQALVRVLVGVP